VRLGDPIDRRRAAAAAFPRGVTPVSIARLSALKGRETKTLCACLTMSR
jgi:hypothetical protein